MKVRPILLGLAGVLIFLVIWQLIPTLGLVSDRHLAPATSALMALAQEATEPRFWTAVGQTLTAWFTGLLVAVGAAVVAGFIIGSSRFLKRFTHSTIEFLRPIPSVALIPLAVLLFGTGIESSLLLIIYACFWQVLIQVLYGVVDVDKVAMDTAKSFGLSRFQRIRYVVWPSALPFLMTGIRLGAAVGLILAVTAELVIGVPGLGREIALAQSGSAIPLMYGLIVAAGILGVLINVLMRVLERTVLAWHTSVRRELPV